MSDVVPNYVQRDHDTVNGYIRMKQQFPNVIIDLCISYYLIVEQFSIGGSNIAITNDGTIISKKNKDAKLTQACFGNIIIECDSKLMYQWSFDVMKSSRDGLMAIGISLSDKPFESVYDGYSYNPFSGWVKERGAMKRYGANLSAGKAKVIMMLNMENGALSYIVNNRECGDAFKIEIKDDISYILAIVMGCSDDKIILTDFDMF